MSAWTKLTPLQRKLELKRRALVRRANRVRLRAAARELLERSGGSPLAFPNGLKDAG